MDQVTRRSIEVDIDGEKWTLSEPDYDTGVEFEKFVRANRLALILEATKDTDNLDRRELIRDATNTPADPGELASEMQTLSGVRYLIYLSLKVTHPDITRQKVKELVTLDNYQELLDISQALEQPDEDEAEEVKNEPEAAASP